MAGFSKAFAYQARTDVDSLETLAKRLQADVRKDLRDLRLVDPFTEDWNKMAGAAFRLGEITEMESKLPRSEGGSLWEGEEVTLRLMMEEGKMALILRLVEQYIAAAGEAKGPLRLVSGGKASSVAAGKFEWGFGTALTHAWNAVEATQVTEPEMYWRVVAKLFEKRRKAASLPAPKLEPPSPLEDDAYSLIERDGLIMQRSMSVCALHWLPAMAQHLGRIDPDKAVDVAVRSGAFVEMLLFCLACHAGRAATPASEDGTPAEGSVAWDDVLAGCKGLGIYLASESWLGRQDEYLRIASPDGLVALGDALIAFDDLYLKEATKMGSKGLGPAWRKALRPIRDAAAAARRGGLAAADPSEWTMGPEAAADSPRHEPLIDTTADTLSGAAAGGGTV